jgi:poly-gamma-glutamate synthesis protein (capsule biosynthesis protein)
VAAVVIVVAGLVLGFGAGQAMLSRASPAPEPAAIATQGPRPSGRPTAGAGTTPEPSRADATPAPTEQPTLTPPPPPVEADVPLVPVVSFWSGASSITSDRIASAVTGNDPVYTKVVVPTGMGDAVDGVFGIARTGTIGGSGKNPLEADPAELASAIADGALGLLPLPDVTPTVKALAVDGVSLFGNDRATSLDEWPLTVHLTLPAYEWDQAKTWTLVAGGDIMPDRGTYEQVTLEGKGVDFPWDGGTASITGHHCCTPFGWPVTESRRTGNKGVVRAIFNDADIALANLEGPVKNDFSYHTHGLTFTGDPRLVRGFDDAGFDFLSLANNHIGNGGPAGLRDTLSHLDDAGIAHAGAGENLDVAATPAYLNVNGTRVAVVSCSEVGGFLARADKLGMLRCSAPETVAAIKAARQQANVVVVFPHWGVEYRARPTASQRNLATAWAKAGADVVLGSHPHWAEAIEDIDGTFVAYCMGNLVFDQTWSENTQQGLIVELTFQGNQLVQGWLHPTLILDAVQPNLLDYSAGGSDVLSRVRAASAGLFPY